MNSDPMDQVKAIEEQSQVCAHCGAENPPGLLLCLVCGRDPVSGRDLFAPPEVPTPDEPPAPMLALPSYDLTVTLPEPIQVPDPLPIPTLEEFTPPPVQPHPTPPPVYRAPPPLPRDMAPLLPPLPRWVVGILGLATLIFLGLGTAGSIATLNLPSSVCLGSLWLAVAIAWLGIVLARRGETRSSSTGARRRLVRALGQRLLEIAPSAAKEQRAQLPATAVPELIRPASQLIYLSVGGDRSSQLTRVLMGTLCALVADDHIELATQTYDVLTANPLRRSLQTIKKTAIARRTLYLGAGYLEKTILETLRQSPSVSARELVNGVLQRVGADVLDRIAVEIAEIPPSEEDAPDLDAQLAALREFCDEFKTLNPNLYEQLDREVEEAVGGWVRTARKIPR